MLQPEPPLSARVKDTPCPLLNVWEQEECLCSSLSLPGLGIGCHRARCLSGGLRTGHRPASPGEGWK